MRVFDYQAEYSKLLTPEIVSLLGKLHEFRGRHALLEGVGDDELSSLLEVAKIQSTEASNRIEGIVTTEDRLAKLVRDKTMPKNRSEKEIAGYRDVLTTIHESYEYIPVKSGSILQLHRDLYRYSGKSIGGNFKDSDNVIAETSSDGSRRVRFEPVHAWETPDYVRQLCESYNETAAQGELDSLILIPMFILDFLCIHPFNDGNGRMSRILTLLLLYRSGYFVGKYVSIEKLIADNKETYYEVLYDSSMGWHEGKNNYEPFVSFMLGIIVAAYRDFSERVELIADREVTKPDRVRGIIKAHLGKITIAEIMRECPDISKITVQRAVKHMLDRNEIIKIGGGRYTSYTWNERE
ncbi:Fic family protein [Alloscardovia venturai]|uniref:Fic family protein n=1 Tax=Alloscardovia venturai TaxID=1769421 RepID=A0ABW2YBE0_9BIFI